MRCQPRQRDAIHLARGDHGGQYHRRTDCAGASWHLPPDDQNRCSSRGGGIITGVGNLFIKTNTISGNTAEKPRDYAEAGIPEYWIVHPLDETITVLTLDGDLYAEQGVFRRGETATSVLLTGFAVSVDAVLDAK
ncbi:MAG: Uma2 family endonuclease [Roseiflexaceae bacterium]|nr:Uma2 family endonuclease [Roseiflexaceae bacterium]